MGHLLETVFKKLSYQQDRQAAEEGTGKQMPMVADKEGQRDTGRL